MDDGVGDTLVLVPLGSGIRPAPPFMLSLRIHEVTINAARSFSYRISTDFEGLLNADTIDMVDVSAAMSLGIFSRRAV